MKRDFHDLGHGCDVACENWKENYRWSPLGVDNLRASKSNPTRRLGCLTQSCRCCVLFSRSPVAQRRRAKGFDSIIWKQTLFDSEHRINNTMSHGSSNHCSSSPKQKECSSPKQKENTFPVWRRPEEIADQSSKSNGVCPEKFHSETKRRTREHRQRINQLLLDEGKKRISKTLELKRSAFKRVTSLRTWPMQQDALSDHDLLLKKYLGQLPSDNEMYHDPGLSGLSSSSSNRSVSARKSCCRNKMASPSGSEEIELLKARFLEEQNFPGPLPLHQVFQPALWSMEPRIFSVEKSVTGKRKYIVGQMGRVLDYYWRKADPNHRHCYELIRENTPCRLYLDLEFSKLSNPDISQEVAEAMLDELLQEISHELTSLYPMDPIARENVVDLDSSTDAKFSRHWILHLPRGYLFAHTKAIGQFMHNLVGRLSDEQATNTLCTKSPNLHRHLFVNAPNSQSDPSKSTCFIDLGVYSRNRLFRIMGSSKFGKPASASLCIASKNQFPFPPGFTNASFYVPALKSQGQPHALDDDLETSIRIFKNATDWTTHAEALAQTLVVPLNATKLDFPILPFEELQTGPVLPQDPTRTIRKTVLSYCKSPYPDIDEFVSRQLACRGGTTGAIRAWSIETAGQTGETVGIVYQMVRNRWCENIKREHKSNNIVWTVDFRSWQCTQSCHDPDCRAIKFRGTPVNVPMSVVEMTQEVLFEEQLVRIASAHSEQIHDADDEEFERALACLHLDDAEGAKTQ